MIDVCGNHRTAARDFITHEFRRDVLADRDELHLRRDLTAASVMHLRDVSAVRCAAGKPRAVKTHGVEFGHRFASAPIDRRRLRERLGVVARIDPGRTQRRDSGANVADDIGIGVRAARVVDGVRLAIGERDRTHRHANRRLRAFDIDFARAGRRRRAVG